MTQNPGTPDYDGIGEDFDRGLAAIAPVADVVLDHLSELPDGATVVDLACGTGEPGLTLARCRPGVRVLGVDRAEGMVAVARRKAEREALGGALRGDGRGAAVPTGGVCQGCGLPLRPAVLRRPGGLGA